MTTELRSAGYSGGSPVRVLAWIGGIGVGLSVVVGLLVYVEGRRGHRAWARCQRELAARGEKLDLKDFVPAPVPDDQNFAAIPLFAGLDFRPGSGGGQFPWPDDYHRADAVRPAPSEDGPRAGVPRGWTDLEGWQRAFRTIRNGSADEPLPVSVPPDATPRQRAALEVLEALKVYEPALEELRAAARRPASRFPIPYLEQQPFEWGWPHLSAIKKIVQVLRLRVGANLGAGRPEAALEDVRLMLRLTDAVKDEPMLLSHLVRLACFHVSAEAIREGLGQGLWSEPQLKELESRLAAYDFVADLQRVLRAERASGVALVEAMLRGALPIEPADQPSKPEPEELLLRRSLPVGWLRAEQANHCLWVQRLLLSDAELRQRIINPKRVDLVTAKVEAGGWWIGLLRHRVLARMTMASLAKGCARFAHAQACAHQARLACALERYRQAKGQYPENLAVLVPDWIDAVPNDVISGEPMRYRRTEDGRFILWSVGWDGRDDGGNNFKGGAGPDWSWEPVAKEPAREQRP